MLNAPKLLIPVGFALLVLQGLSEIIKRIAYLRGTISPAAKARISNLPSAVKSCSSDFGGRF